MKLPELTETELDVMKVLWQKKRLSAREVHDHLGAAHAWSYSTTRTVLDRMAKKALVDKEAFHGLNLYTPAIGKAEGLARFVRRFAAHVLETDIAPVVSLLAENDTLTSEELAHLTHLLDTAEEEPA